MAEHLMLRKGTDQIGQIQGLNLDLQLGKVTLRHHRTMEIVVAAEVVAMEVAAAAVAARDHLEAAAEVRISKL